MRISTERLKVPKSVDEWTISTGEGLVAQDYLEVNEVDFKGFLVAPEKAPYRDRFLEDIRATACAFANADGGFIVFGVADAKSKRGSERLVGIPRGDSAKLFADSLSIIEPIIRFSCQNPPMTLSSDESKVVFVVKIPHSPMAPHTFGRDGKYLFYKRSAGNQPMTFAQVDRAFAIKHSAISKLTLIHLQLSNSLTLLGYVQAEAKDKKVLYPRMGPNADLLEATLGDVYPIICEDGEFLLHLNRVIIAARVVNAAIERSTGTLLSGRLNSKKAVPLPRQPNAWRGHTARRDQRSVAHTERQICGHI